ncbi:FmdB family zinc ribbon protein [Jatrophihabitans sp.]|uniref:FmdB family zinc ribbon protein n=1 Tax=Jatrophihabitans sp. TaxID=1932789 RepID=UPI002C79E465|nr:FmdB family zinc ribbon protein [Jatrophihabitans sp.]
MPTYQYACTSTDCGLRFERVQAFTDPAISECPECNERVRKVYGSVGVVFKGSGFYRTDSREKTGAGAKSDGSAKSGDAGKGSDAAKSADAGKASSSGSSGSGESGSAAKAPAAATAS